MKKIQSVGKCVYCQKTFSKAGISKHLATHLTQEEAKGQTQETAIHIAVSDGQYFLHLLVPGKSSLKVIDTYLRKIWLECCDHLSGFSAAIVDREVGMAKKVKDVFEAYNKLNYQYDYGSTTELDLVYKGTYLMEVKSIVLLSRNEPHPIICENCKIKPAVNICTIHMYSDEPSFFCNDCTPLHEAVCEDFADYANLPVVNSPRCGVCDYTGGTIDRERDGVYVLPS